MAGTDIVWVIFFVCMGGMLLTFAVLYLTLVWAGAKMIVGIVKDEIARSKPEERTEANTLLRPADPGDVLLRPAGR